VLHWLKDGNATELVQVRECMHSVNSVVCLALYKCGTAYCLWFPRNVATYLQSIHGFYQLYCSSVVRILESLSEFHISIFTHDI